MGSVSEVNQHLPSSHLLTGISRGTSSNGPTHPAAFLNASAFDYQERYVMEMQQAAYGRSYRNVYRQHPMESSSLWQLPASASDLLFLQSAESSMSGSSAVMASERGTESSNKRSPAPLQSSAPELYEKTVVGGDWQKELVDSGARYRSLLPHSSGPLSHSLHTGTRGLNEGATVRELIGKFGANKSISHLRGASLMSAPQSHSTGAEKAHIWNSGEVQSDLGFVSVDPSKGGPSLDEAGLGTSHSLAHISSDPGFVERAARFSSFSNSNYRQPLSSSTIETGEMRSRSSTALRSECSPKHLLRTSSYPALSGSAVVDNASESVVSENRGPVSDDPVDDGSGAIVALQVNARMLSRTSSNLVPTEEEAEQGGMGADGPVEIQGASCVEHAAVEACLSGASDTTAAKRKNHTHEEKSRDAFSGERDAKRTPTLEGDNTKVKRFKRGGEDSLKDKEIKSKEERSSSETSGASSPRSTKDHSKPSEPPKPDYIHVRARRGQATDSHSLAERVRREKISERMKFLQDLVPGCSKVTGKAVMLDEIINYVQSLQRQVEFLSMKLASVNPRLDFNLESLLGKEVSSQPGSQPLLLSPEITAPYPQLHQQHQAQLHGLEHPLHSDATLTRTLSSPPFHPTHRLDGGSQQPTVWDDGELQSVVQMGFGQNPNSMPSQAFQCHVVPPRQVKVEFQQSPITCL